MKRRSFLKSVSGAVGASALASQNASAQEAAAPEQVEVVKGLPRRSLGASGEKVSIVAFPGLALRQYDQDEGTKGLHRAFDSGVNHFDVAPAYDNLKCEMKMGIGLEGIPRDEIFLSCKTKMRDAKGAREELERSLKHLKTDRFDLYQLHCLFEPSEVEQAMAPGGAMETILKAKEEGRIGLIGFSAHTTRAALAAMKAFPFDTVMFPINFVEYFRLGFGKPVLELAEEKGMSVLAIKSLSRGAWPQGMERTRKWWYRCTETPEETSMAMRFTLSLPQVKTSIPPSWLDLNDMAIEACKAYTPITDAETEQLRAIAADSESVFQQRELAVTHRKPGGCPFSDSPHEIA